MHTEHYYQQFLTNNPYPRQLVENHSDTQPLLNFASSDYLGLSTHPTLIENNRLFAEQWGVGVGTSRLVADNLPIYSTLEKQIAHGVGCDAALIMGAGYQTNMSVLRALLDNKVLGQQPLVFCDRHCHASIYNGISHLRLKRFRHNDLIHLEQLLQASQHLSAPKFIIVESLYSMEGDCADLAAIIALAKKYHAFLYVDDAHSVGTTGPAGWGLASLYPGQIDMVMGTFSKGLGSFGAYIACSAIMRDYLINRCQGLIYSTGLPPSVLGSIAAAVTLLPNLHAERQRLWNHAKQLQQFMQQKKFDSGVTTTYIVPWIIGDSQKAVSIAAELRKHGILATAIRPPSVPVGKSRIRFCLSARHTSAHLNQLITVIECVSKNIM